MTSSAVRAAGFFGFWLILTGFSLANAAVGVLAAAVATRASLILLPPGHWRPQPLLFFQMGLRFLYQSVSAGITARTAEDVIAWAPNKARPRPPQLDLESQTR